MAKKHYKYNLKEIFRKVKNFPDRTDEFREKLEDLDWIKKQNVALSALRVTKNLQFQLDCINSSIGPLGGKIINPDHPKNGMSRVSLLLKSEIDDEFCYVVDHDNNGYKYSKNFIDKYFKNNKNLLYVQMIYGGYDRFTLNDSSKLYFDFSSGDFINKNSGFEHNYENHDSSVEENLSSSKKEKCQLTYELLGDWQFVGGESNSPPYVWVDSDEKFLEERNDLDSYFEAINYNYKLICQINNLEIDSSQYLNYSVDHYEKNKTYLSLSSDSNKANNFIINLKQKATCQMFVYFKTKIIGWSRYNETEDAYEFYDGADKHMISKDRVIKIDLGLEKYTKRQTFAFLFFSNPSEKTFTNKIQLSTSQLENCQPITPNEKPVKIETQPEPSKQE